MGRFRLGVAHWSSLVAHLVEGATNSPMEVWPRARRAQPRRSGTYPKRMSS
jgi:hypothetical protein